MINLLKWLIGIACWVMACCLAPTVYSQSWGEVSASDGAVLHYRVMGAGEPLLLLTGGPGFSGDYLLPVAEELRKAYRTILPDQRGTGKSQLSALDTVTINLKAAVDDLETLRQHLEVDKFTVLGHSWGGMLGMAYAADYPGSVKTLVLVGSGGINLDFIGYFGANIRGRLLPMELAAEAYWSDSTRVAADPKRASYEQLRAILPAYVFDRKHALPLVEAVTPKAYNSPVNTLMWANLQKINYDLRSALQAFEQPVLVVQGRQDVIGESTAFQIHHTFPNSTLEFIEECGHFPWIEQPQSFYKMVLAFLQEP